MDGDVVAAAQEERFTRRKHDPGFPAQAVDYCLSEAGLSGDDLDYVAFYDKPLTKFERLLETYLAYAPAGFPSFRLAMPLWLREKLHLPPHHPAGVGRGETASTRASRSPHWTRPAASSTWHNSKWWLLPILVVLLLLGALFLLSGTAAAPFVYTLF